MDPSDPDHLARLVHQAHGESVNDALVALAELRAGVTLRTNNNECSGLEELADGLGAVLGVVHEE